MHCSNSMVSKMKAWPFSNWWSTDLSSELDILRQKLSYLAAQKDDVYKDVENSEVQPGKKRKSVVEWWFGRVDEKKAELKRIEELFETQCPSSDLKSQITKETKEVEELIQQGKSFGTVVLDDHSSTGVEMVVTDLVGPDSGDNVETIRGWLRDNEVFAIGVHGMGGVGKTTLLKKINNALRQDSEIRGQVYWVTASQDCSLQKLQISIGKRLGLNDLREEDDESRRSLIFRKLSDKQKTVIIIDDMWNYFPVDQVGILKSCGCKIVITSRSSEVCRKMGCQKVIKVSPLANEDAWSLFVNNSGEVPHTIIPTARGIVEECGGLPLALITMGCCMRDISDICLWENALYELKRPTSKEDDMEDRVFKILKYSYNGLADEKLQHCFLSGVLFPEDEKIERGRLIDLWIMEGLLDDTEGWENKVNKGHTILNRLESTNLLEPTLNWIDQRCVSMHDLIRDMAMIITQHHPRYMAKAGLQLVKVPEEKDWTADLVKVSLSNNCIKELPCCMSCMTLKLRVLILSHNKELEQVPESFFLHMEALEVLDLSGTGIRRLPHSVSYLVNLRGLLLEGCRELEYVPSVAKLTKLMVIHLPKNRFIKEAPEGIEKLKCLEKLPYSYWRASDLQRINSLLLSCPLSSYKLFLGESESGPLWVIGEEGYDNVVLMRDGALEQLTIAPVISSTIQMLHIENCSLGEAIPFLRDATELTRLVICDCKGLVYLSLPPHESSSLKFLILRSLPDLRSLSTFSQLKELEISNCQRGKVVFPSMSICLPYLEEIDVCDCDEVAEICDSGSKFVDLPNLRKVRLKNLPNLGSIYSLQLHLCTSLEEIHIEDCPQLQDIFISQLGEMMSENLTDRINVTDPYDIVVFPNLKCLSLLDLPKLGNICSKTESIIESSAADTKLMFDLPSLESLCLRGLPNLSSIYLMRLHLSTLENIDIRHCPKLEGIFILPSGDTISEEANNRANVTNLYSIVVFPNLKCLTLIGLPKLGSNYSEHNCIIAYPAGDAKLILNLPSLKNLWLNGLPNLSSLYWMRLHLSTSLESIDIGDCPKLEGIFTSPLGDTISREVNSRANITDICDVINLPNLNHLSLRKLPKFSSIYLKYKSIISSPSGDTKPILDLPSLKEIWLRGLPNLSSVYSMRLHLSTSVESICIEKCPKLEGIFMSPIGGTQTILVFHRLCFLELRRLPSLSTIYKGLFMCSSMGSKSFAYLDIHECPQLKWLPLSKKLICDVSPSTVGSFPTEHENPEWWKPLLRDVPEDASRLSDFINQARRSSPISQSYNNDDHQHLETNSQASPSAFTFLPSEPKGLVLMPASQSPLVLHNTDNDVDDKTTWGRELSLSSS